ncbi:DUF2382 domain-containing protein [Patulibacter sp. S7RM1-6]
MAIDDVQDWKGRQLVGRDGSKIGKIDEIYVDDRTGRPEWALVNTGLFGTKSSFVPIADVQASGDDLSVPFDKDTVKGAPNIDEDGHLEPDEERELYRYYGRGDYDAPEGDAGTDRTAAGTGGAAGRTDATAGTDAARGTGTGTADGDAMTRSEEELHVGTREREVGKVRLRKYVVTENVTKTVPVSHEEVRLEREPITDANRGDALGGPDIAEAEHEVTLHAEEPVVDKEVVPKERVRLDTDVVRDEREVSDEVRKERIETDDDAGRR